jgi:hypothetical protein
MLTNTVWYKKDTKVAWVQQEGEDIAIYYDVNSVERGPTSSKHYPVYILGEKKIIGIVWNVAEIKKEI